VNTVLCKLWLGTVVIASYFAVNEKNALASEVQQKTHVASSQRVSGVDAQRINSQLTELKGRLSQADKELVELDHDLGTEEQLYRQEKMSVSSFANMDVLM